MLKAERQCGLIAWEVLVSNAMYFEYENIKSTSLETDNISRRRRGSRFRLYYTLVGIVTPRIKQAAIFFINLVRLDFALI